MTFPNQPKEHHPNPWNLTPAEEKWLVRYDRHGTAMLASAAFGNSVYTVREALYSAQKKMGVPSKAAAVIKYKLWVQAAEVTVLSAQIITLTRQLEQNRYALHLAEQELASYRALNVLAA